MLQYTSNLSGVMEKETISKNGASSKSQMSRRNSKNNLLEKNISIFKILCIGVIITMSVCVNAQILGGFSLNGSLLPTDINNNFYLGVTLDLGFYLKEKNYLLFNVGYSEGLTTNEIGTFSYSTKDKYGNITTFDNGVINRKSGFIPIFVNWNWIIPISNNISFHIGPSVGETTIRAYNKYFVGKNEWEPDSELGEKNKPKHNRYKALFSAGANASIMLFEGKDDTKWGIGYKYLWSGKKSFEDDTFKGKMHQFSIVILFL